MSMLDGTTFYIPGPVTFAGSIDFTTTTLPTTTVLPSFSWAAPYEYVPVIPPPVIEVPEGNEQLILPKRRYKIKLYA